jgi:hypothetical protein
MSERGTMISAASSVLSTLPAQFLALVLLNTAFLGGLLWFLNSVDDRRMKAETIAIDTRERMLTPVLTACINAIPIAALPHLAPQQKP